MPTRKAKTEAGGRQLPVRFSPQDSQHLDEMQQHLEQDAATIVRWAVRYFHRVAEQHGWNVSSRGEPIDLSPPAPAEEEGLAPPTRTPHSKARP